MALKVSTGLRNKMLDTGALKNIMSGSLIKIYSGPVPDTADAAIGGTNMLLCTVSVNSTGTGVTFDTTAVNATIAKNPAEVWTGVNAAAGTASFYRLVAAGDDGTSNTVQARIQGSIGLAGADMNFTSTALSLGATQTIDYFVVALTTL